jgi:hypothetical protein
VSAKNLTGFTDMIHFMGRGDWKKCAAAIHAGVSFDDIFEGNSASNARPRGLAV